MAKYDFDIGVIGAGAAGLDLLRYWPTTADRWFRAVTGHWSFDTAAQTVRR